MYAGDAVTEALAKLTSPSLSIVNPATDKCSGFVAFFTLSSASPENGPILNIDGAVEVNRLYETWSEPERIETGPTTTGSVFVVDSSRLPLDLRSLRAERLSRPAA